MISSDFCSGNLSRAEEGDEEGCVSNISISQLYSIICGFLPTLCHTSNFVDSGLGSTLE